MGIECGFIPLDGWKNHPNDQEESLQMNETRKLLAEIDRLNDEIRALTFENSILKIENEQLRKDVEFEKLYTTEETCEALRLNRTTLKRLMDEGKISYHQSEYGGKILIEKNEIYRYLAGTLRSGN